MGKSDRVTTHPEGIYAENVFSAIYSVPPDPNVTPWSSGLPLHGSFLTDGVELVLAGPRHYAHCYSTGRGAEGWTGNSMVEECWGSERQEDTETEKKQESRDFGVNLQAHTSWL